MKNTSAYILTLFLLCYGYLHGANTFRVGLDQGGNIKPYLEIYTSTSSGDDSLNDLWTSTSFVPIADDQEPPLAKTYYWLRVNVSNAKKNVNASEWVMSFDIALTDIDVYLRRSDGEVETFKAGFFTPNHKKSFAPTTKANLIKLSIDQGEEVELLIKVYSTRLSLLPVFDISIADVDTFYGDLSHDKQLNLLYIGFVLMMLTFNIFMYFFRHDKANIYYSLYLLIVVIFIAYNTGNLADWIQDVVTPDRPEYMYFFKLICYLGFVSYLKFIRYFLDLKKVNPFWDTIFKIMSWLAIPWILGDIALMFISDFSPNVSDFATVSYAFIFIGITTLMLIPLSKTRAVKNQYVLWGIIVMNSTIVLTLLLRLQGIDFSTLPFKVGSIIEIILFSLALVYRQQRVELDQQKIEHELERNILLQNQEKAEAKRLKEFNEFKSKLYANMTHEFRTPLTVIMGMADKIKHDDRTKEMIKRSGTTMLTLINQLLDLSKAEANQLTINKARGDLVQYTQYLIESISSAAHEKNITMNFSSAPDSLVMDFDPSLVQHIVHNLLSNAIKFTPIGGEIKINLSLKGGAAWAKLEIEDNGVGISDEEMPYIFDRFYQSPRNSVSSGGTGIGLALVKEIVDLLKGNISVNSDENGSRFVVMLPTELIDNPASQELTLDKAEIYKAQSTIEDSDIRMNEERPIVLIVEDNKDVMIYIQSCFDEGYEVISAMDGEKGLALAKLYVPDIILTDLMMPIMDGVTLVNHLKNQSSTNHIPVIMITAKTGHRDRLSALEYGVEAYLTKPFDGEELIIRVNALLKQRKELHKYYVQSLSGDSNSQVLDQSNPLDPFVQEIRELVMNNLSNESFTTEEIQNQTGLSRTQLYRKLKSLTDMSGLQFINHTRLEEAQRLLKNEDSMSIAEISYKVGFSDPNYFSRKFSNFYGLTPKEFRVSEDVV